ncbi:MAG: molecular chaperone [Thioalkalivibrionaceae bacterium]
MSVELMPTETIQVPHQGAMEPSSPAESLALRAERYLCLAQAFLPPDREQRFCAMRNLLVDDLRGLFQELGDNPRPLLHALKQDLAVTFADHTLALRTYAGLFLSPPVPAHINTAWYQDGSLMGRHMDDLQAFYQRHGLGRREGFKDLPDHAAMQLEFASVLLATCADALQEGDDVRHETLLGEAHDFLESFPLAWLPGLRSDIARCTATPQDPEQLYLTLTDLLIQCVRDDVQWLSARLPERTMAPRHTDTNSSTETTAMQVPESRSIEAQAFIAARLAEAGLDTSHLAIPEGQRDTALGLHAIKPVVPKRHSR